MGRFTAGNSADPERLERILNAKQRLIGVDTNALDAQVAEKQRTKEAEKAAELLYADLTASHAGQLTLGQLDADAARKEWDKELQTFRSTQQGKAITHEWDLNRPDAKSRDSPARLGDNDPRCGPASLQQFAGEDLQIGERVTAQMKQCKAWWDEQSAIKARQAQQQREQQGAYGEHIKNLDTLQSSMIGQEAAARAELARQVAEANRELCELQAGRHNAAREAELQAKLAELAAAQADPWLSEDPHQADSSISPNRVRKDHWKGMSQQQRDAIMQQQLSQVEARRAAAAAAAAAEAEAAAAQRNIHKTVMQQAQAAEEFKRKQAAAAAATLKEQMVAKAARDAQVKELYANKVTDEYFNQFGTSHR